MATVLIEAVHSTPLLGAQLTAFVQRSQDCLNARNIRRVCMYISPDGTRTLCETEAINADTVREVCYKAGIPFEHIWAADVVEYPPMVHPQGDRSSSPVFAPLLSIPSPPEQPDSHLQGSVVRILVLSLYTPPLTEAYVQEMKTNLALHPCLEIRRVQKLRTLISGDRCRSICEFSATDADTLRDAFRQENVPFERVWTAQWQTTELL